jgi:hypothetical protein
VGSNPDFCCKATTHKQAVDKIKNCLAVFVWIASELKLLVMTAICCFLTIKSFRRIYSTKPLVGEVILLPSKARAEVWVRGILKKFWGRSCSLSCSLFT